MTGPTPRSSPQPAAWVVGGGRLAGRGGLSALILGGWVLAAAAGGPGPDSRQSSLSTRAEVGLGGNAEIIGFVIRKREGAPGDGAKLILLRVLGPALAAQGVSHPLRHPVLALLDAQGGLIAADAGWQNSPEMSPGYFWHYEAEATSRRPGAMVRPAQARDWAAAGVPALPPGAEDSALVALLPPGAYTVKVSGAPDTAESDDPTTGVARTEIYALEDDDDSRFAVLSARASVNARQGLDVTGIVAPGTGGGRFLIRGVGPSLGRFDVPGPIRWPILTVSVAGGPVLASNEGWGSPPQLASSLPGMELRAATAADMAAVGAFALHAGSSDSALVMALPPGAYTANVIAADHASGIALVEFYRMAPQESAVSPPGSR